MRLTCRSLRTRARRLQSVYLCNMYSLNCVRYSTLEIHPQHLSREWSTASCRDISSGTHQIARVRKAFQSAADILTKSKRTKMQQGRLLELLFDTAAARQRGSQGQQSQGVGFKRGRDRSEEKRDIFQGMARTSLPPPVWNTAEQRPAYIAVQTPSHRAYLQEQRPVVYPVAPVSRPVWGNGREGQRPGVTAGQAAAGARSQEQRGGRGWGRASQDESMEGGNYQKMPRLSEQERYYNTLRR